MATIEQAASALRSWAITRNLYSTDFPIYSNIPPDSLFANQNLRQFSHSETILKEKNITGFGYNETSGTIFVLLKKHLSKKDLDSLPKFLTQEFRVDYIQASNAQAQQPSSAALPYTLTAQQKYTCGSSIHPARHIGAGTLGCLVKNSNGEIFGLSNNHVTGNCNFSQLNEQILAPGHPDIYPGMLDPFTIGHHYQSAPFVAGVPANVNVANNSDAAIFRIADLSKVSSMQGSNYDTPDQIDDIQAGYNVQKVGRTTGYTQGYVVNKILGPFPCTYPVHGVGNQLAFFEDVFLVTNPNGGVFSTSGDSGSLVVAELNGVLKAVGMVFAGDPQGNSYVLPIRNILQYFNVELVRGHNV